MTDYKETLNLPKTAFPMKANLNQREPEVLKKWQEMDIFKQLSAHWQGREKFIFHDGPPYANGNIHLGHAVNKTLKDIVTKSKMLSGYAAPFVPGWDCHGLPIELNVEKKEGKAGDKISATDFRQKCREYAAKFIDIQREEFKRLGVIADWDNPYKTMDFKYEANIIRALAKVIARGDVKQGFKPVFWCFDCASALAQAEVEYKDKTSPSITVRFTVNDENDCASRFALDGDAGVGHITVPIWTTTPWTLPANAAVAVHPELEYVLLQTTGESVERFIVASELQASFEKLLPALQFNRLGICQGEALLNCQLQHPFYEKLVPIVVGDHVTTEAGSGCVHTAPAHGPDDYKMGQKYELDFINPVQGNGVFNQDLPLFGGQFVWKANKAIIEILQQNNKLIHQTTLNHSYPHCWRHKSALIFRATPQWFISMDQQGLRQLALKEIEKVKWFPQQGQMRISTMVINNPDWCISRQRTWGTPITVFLHNETNEMHPDSVNVFAKVATLVEQHGIDAWYDCDAKELIGDDAKNYYKSTDVLDVWFDSGVTHYCVLEQRPELQFPADLYLEGSDQHRGWFQSSLLSSIAINQCAPYKAVLTHGFTIDDKGRKMSKSLGNGIEPEKIIKTMGADILRLWIAQADYQSDIALSQEILKRISDAYRRIRNTVRYLLANTDDFNSKTDLIANSELLALDKYALRLAKNLQTEIIEAYDRYQFHQVFQKIHHFCSIEMGGFYLDIIKDRQYTTKTNSQARRSAQTAMHHILRAMTRWLAPILSFTAEEIWQYCEFEEFDSVFFASWYDNFGEVEDNQFNDEFWQDIINVRDCVNKQIEQLRHEDKVGSSLDADVKLYCDEKLKNKIDLLAGELRFILITSSATCHDLTDKSSQAVPTSIDGLFIDVSPSSNRKCIRCWHHRDDIGKLMAHPDICQRCVENVNEGKGEKRHYA